MDNVIDFAAATYEARLRKAWEGFLDHIQEKYVGQLDTPEMRESIRMEAQEFLDRMRQMKASC